jgi:hypothetical protein
LRNKTVQQWLAAELILSFCSFYVIRELYKMKKVPSGKPTPWGSLDFSERNH